MERTDALVLVGHGRYEDPWHDVVAASHTLAGLLADAGAHVSARATRPDALEDLDPPGLLVVVAGAGRRDPDFDGDDDAWLGFHDRRAEWVAGGVPVVAVHQASMAFADDGRWASDLGGRWVEGRSWHPPLGPTTLRVTAAHDVTAGLDRLELVDERYAQQAVAPGIRPLVVADLDAREAAGHAGAEGPHPVVWLAPGPTRVVYDALGHDLRSYASPTHRRLLTNAIGWLLDR